MSERESRYEEYRLRGKDLLKEFEGRKASISEQDRKEACKRLGLPYEPKKDVANAEALITKLEETKKKQPQYIIPSH